MKKYLFILFLTALSCSASGTNLIPAPFKGWGNAARARITAANGIVTMTANTDPRVNRYQKMQIELPFKKEMRGKTLELSFKYRSKKLNGSVQVAVRQAYAQGGSYHGVRLKKWDISEDWQSYRHTFTVRKETKRLMLYWVGYHMKQGEKVDLKDLKLTFK